jgi:hypothetical protein
VGHVPAEIDFNCCDLPIAHGEDLGIAKACLLALALIGDEYMLAMLRHVHDLEIFAVRASGPADREIAVAIQPVVERASEAKSVGQETFGGAAILATYAL